MGLIGLRVELRALRHAINELYVALEKQSEITHLTVNKENQVIPNPIPVAIQYDQQTAKDQKDYYVSQQNIVKWTKRAVIAAGIYAGIAAVQAGILWRETNAAKKSADAAYLAAEALRPQLSIAYLTPAPLTANGLPINDGKLHVQFQVPNYGSNAAQNAWICEFDGVAPQGKDTKLPYGNCSPSSRWSYGSPVIPPIALSGNQVPGWGMDGTHSLTETEIRELKQTDLSAVFSVMGTYNYGGRTHHAESCVIFTFDQKWGNQTIGSWGSKACPWETTND